MDHRNHFANCLYSLFNEIKKNRKNRKKIINDKINICLFILNCYDDENQFIYKIMEKKKIGRSRLLFNSEKYVKRIYQKDILYDESNSLIISKEFDEYCEILLNKYIIHSKFHDLLYLSYIASTMKKE